MACLCNGMVCQAKRLEATFLLSSRVPIILHFKSVIYSFNYSTLPIVLPVKLLDDRIESFDLTIFRKKNYFVKLSEILIQFYRLKCFKLTLFAENKILILSSNRKLFVNFTVSYFTVRGFRSRPNSNFFCLIKGNKQ